MLNQEPTPNYPVTEPDDVLRKFVKGNLNHLNKIFTGYKQVDEIVDGLRAGNTYLVAGLEKSGKSTFLMGIANYLLDSKQKVCFINTELSLNDFTCRMATSASKGEKTIKEIETEAISADRPGLSTAYQWLKKSKDLLTHYCIEDSEILDKGRLSFDRTAIAIDNAVKQGAGVVIIDNLTSYGSTDEKKDLWVNISRSLQRVIDYTKTKGIVSLVVIHTKPQVIWTETVAGVRALIEENNPIKIFDDSLTINRRPSLQDVYGGGSANSQISGSFLIWRPFQKIKDPKLQKMSMVVLESFRHSPSGEVLMAFFGEHMRFVEVKKDETEENVKKYVY